MTASQLCQLVAGQRFKPRDPLDLFAEELDAQAHPRGRPGKTSTVSPRTRNWPRANSMSLRVVLQVDQAGEQLVARTSPGPTRIGTTIAW